MTETLWKLQDVQLGGVGRPRLSDVSLEIPTGVIAVLGLSGAGKTSLLNILARFEKPDEGSVTFLKNTESRLPVYWSPSDNGLWPHLTAWQHLEVVCDSPDQWLQRFDLTEVANALPETLSMGERSRLSVARALATNTTALIFDEPLNHVDRARLHGYWDVICRTCAERNTSLLFSSHDPAIVLRHASHVICLDDSRVIWEGRTEDLYQQPESEQLGWFLGPLNWFTTEEAKTWLGMETAQPVPLRPERLEICPADDGPLVVESVHASGSIGETELTVHDEGESRRVFHRAVGNVLQQGARAALRVCMALLLMFLLGIMQGCEDSEASLIMPVSEFVPISFPAEGAKLPAPRGLTFSPDGELYTLDDVGRVLVYDIEGKLARKWWMPEYSVGRPEGVCVMHDGRIVVADTHYNQCVYFDTEGKVLGKFGSFGEELGQFIYPIAITQDDEGNLYVAENGGNDRIQKFTKDGEIIKQIGTCGVEPGEFQRPSGVVWWEDKLYVADAFNNRVLQFTDDGAFEQVIADAESAGLHYPYDLAMGPDQTLYVVEYGAGRVTHIDLNGTLLGQFGQEGRGDGEFWTPWGLAVRHDGTVFVADTGNRRMVELKP
ncbi:MAG: ATP-binding cassette domain-containing protein [Planctomycetaceae bacterium]|nr:ATP-binding cassette domain-containing protein [Planctomycetaceae bacterium]MCB9953839.1 ATP-binding cassette domain-containing protein [Planctomycetaceae bacterium]